MDSHGNQMVQVEPGVTAPVDAVMMPMEHAMSGAGCLSMFNSAGTTSGKRFVRTSKPAAGSSLNVSSTRSRVHLAPIATMHAQLSSHPNLQYHYQAACSMQACHSCGSKDSFQTTAHHHMSQSTPQY